MAGQNVSTTPVSTADTAASLCSKVNANIAAITTELARKVAPADLDVISDVSARGHGFTEVGRVLMEDEGLTFTDAGSFYYNGGNFYLVTAGGLIQLTAGGTLNVTVNGGIRGDYVAGGSTAAVTYTHSTKVFDFTDAPGVSAHLRGESVILVADTSGSTLEIKAKTTLITNSVWVLPELPASGLRHVLTIDTDGTVRDDDTVAAATTFSAAATFSNGLTTGADTHHTDSWTSRVSILNDNLSTLGCTISNVGNISIGNVQHRATALGGNVTMAWALRPRVGDRIRSVSIVASKFNTQVTTLSLCKTDETTDGLTTLYSATTTSSGAPVTVTASGTPGAVDATAEWYVLLTTPSDGAGSLYWNLLVTYDHP